MRWQSTWVTVLGLALALPAAAQHEAGEGERPAVRLQVVDLADAKLVFQNVPWGPQTFATMESPSDSFYNKRTWPFARLETRRPLKLEGQSLPAGNYALVFVPASSERPDMSLEVLKVAAGEFFQEGNPMTRTPAGESVFKAPVRFERVGTSVPALDVKLAPAGNALVLDVAYGDRRLSRRFER